ncbi:MAG: LysM peptidoglycan-binding domain-containing protein, partial [Verrucomicrobiales bacterium]|nr:LysM peptidoglycan-binding domain-containing protein [Verrucomicrobiales bacterium]
MKVAFFCVVGAHLLGLMVLLIQGCKREPALPPPAEPAPPTLTDTGLPPVVDTNLPPPPPTNVVMPPPMVELPPPQPPQPPQPAVQEYVVQKGDTFDSIGRKHGISWKAIQDANPNVDPKRLQIGQKIVIPAPGAAAAPATTGAPAPSGGERVYVVKSGDTLTKIARQHGTTVKALREANKLRTDRIRVGDKLV